jgi:hypothetical protein
MDEHQLKGLCYNCDEKYFPGHKCKEQNLFMVVTEDLSEEYVVVLPVEELPLSSNLTPPSDPVLAPILPLSSWYSRKKVLGACVLIFMPSKNSQSKTNSLFMPLMTSWMN